MEGLVYLGLAVIGLTAMAVLIPAQLRKNREAAEPFSIQYPDPDNARRRIDELMSSHSLEGIGWSAREGHSKNTFFPASKYADPFQVHVEIDETGRATSCLVSEGHMDDGGIVVPFGTGQFRKIARSAREA